MWYRNKTYVCLDFDADKSYYRLMQARKEHDKIDFDFHNAHDLNNIWSESQEDSIKRKLRERLQNTKNMIVLIWEKTKYKHKFVTREMEMALKLDIPIIWVNIKDGSKSKRSIDNNLVPSIIKNELVIYVPFGQKIIKYALDNRPNSYTLHKKKWETWAHHYKDQVYTDLWL